jgi:ribosome-associated translation inhibitor RaiA
MESNEELINLGNTIELSGFKHVDSGEMIIAKKLIGTQVRKLQDMIPDFERLKINLKPVHKTEQNMLHELHSEIIYAGKVINAQTTNRNLFMALSSIFNSFEEQVKK